MFIFMAQGIGFIALILTIIVFQSNNRKTMLYLQMAAAFFFSLHFALLGALTGSVTNFIGIGRSYVFAQREDKNWANNYIWLYLFIISFLSPINTPPFFAPMKVFSPG